MIKRDGRVTPENITELKKGQVFVFGSNESGIHGAGAALTAKEKFGAEMGKGYGPTGQCFAIPTKSWDIKGILPIPVLECYIARFTEYAMMHPEKTFLVTKIGCGLAGYEPKDIAPIFSDCTHLNNIHLPEEFWDILNVVTKEEMYDRLKIDHDNPKNELSNV